MPVLAVKPFAVNLGLVRLVPADILLGDDVVVATDQFPLILLVGEVRGFPQKGRGPEHTAVPRKEVLIFATIEEHRKDIPIQSCFVVAIARTDTARRFLGFGVAALFLPVVQNDILVLIGEGIDPVGGVQLTPLAAVVVLVGPTVIHGGHIVCRGDVPERLLVFGCVASGGVQCVQ